ncbi:hypothetical protein EBZ39_05720 [bacterium]|nr:hypothetical protein [bacterium]
MLYQKVPWALLVLLLPTVQPVAGATLCKRLYQFFSGRTPALEAMMARHADREMPAFKGQHKPWGAFTAKEQQEIEESLLKKCFEERVVVPVEHVTSWNERDQIRYDLAMERLRHLAAIEEEMHALIRKGHVVKEKALKFLAQRAAARGLVYDPASHDTTMYYKPARAHLERHKEKYHAAAAEQRGMAATSIKLFGKDGFEHSYDELKAAYYDAAAACLQEKLDNFQNEIAP